MLDQTISMTQQLEMKLLTRIKQAGVTPRIAMMMEGKSENNLDAHIFKECGGDDDGEVEEQINQIENTDLKRRFIKEMKEKAMK